MAHHRDPSADECAHAVERRPGAFELDRVGARLLDEADRVVHRLLVGHLERAERHVRHHERAPRPARDRAGEDEHLLHRRRHGRVVAEHGHRRRVADEDQVGAGGVCEPAGRGVVGGHHRDRLVPRLQLCELGQRQLAGRRRAGGGLSGTGGHASSTVSLESRTTLSIRRVEPTRTAAARTGGS